MTALSRPFLVVALVALFVSGCGAADGGHNDADVAFATDMVPHHQQAVQMSDIVLAKTDVSAEVRALATTIRSAQAPEIETMTGWLRDWGAPAPGMSGMGGMGDGMLTTAQLDDLSAARGKEAGTLFLQGMVGHHEGAVAMAETEVGQGENADAKALAAKIVTSQQAEINQMKGLLASR